MVKRSTGEVFDRICRQWDCPVCAHILARRHRRRLDLLLDEAVDRGERVQWLHLTLAPAEPWRAFAPAAWGKVRRNLAYAPGLAAFAAVHHRIGRKGGPPNMHVIVVGGPEITEDRLRVCARRGGFGEHVQVDQIPATARDVARLARYQTGEMASDGQYFGPYVTHLRLATYSTSWPVPRNWEAAMTAATPRHREELADAQARRRVHVAAIRHGMWPPLGDAYEDPDFLRLARMAVLLTAEEAEGPAARAIREAAGPVYEPIRILVREAARVARTYDADQFDDALLQGFPGWSADVLRLILHLRPEWIGVYELRRRRFEARLRPQGVPRDTFPWPDFPTPPSSATR
ncbi:MAG: hypothetical protein U0S48_18620 [Solirubrobacteraceae bacterium]